MSDTAPTLKEITEWLLSDTPDIDLEELMKPGREAKFPVTVSLTEDDAQFIVESSMFASTVMNEEGKSIAAALNYKILRAYAGEEVANTLWGSVFTEKPAPNDPAPDPFDRALAVERIEDVIDGPYDVDEAFEAIKAIVEGNDPYGDEEDKA